MLQKVLAPWWNKMQPRSSNRPPHLNLKTSSYSFLPLCNRASHNLFSSSNLTNSRKQMLWSLIQRRQLLGIKCSTWLEWLQQLSLRHRNKRQKIVSRLTIARSCQGRLWQVATVLQLNSLLSMGPQLRGEKERLGIWKQLPNDWSINVVHRYLSPRWTGIKLFRRSKFIFPNQSENCLIHKCY